MADTAHEYATTVDWVEARRGTVAAEGRSAVATGAPPEFGGSGDVWSPEHLCVGAVNACIMLTFLTIAENSKVPIRAYSAIASGTLEKSEGRMAITRIVVRPRITVGPEVDRTKLERLVAMSEKNCFISNSLKAQVTLEPEIIVA